MRAVVRISQIDMRWSVNIIELKQPYSFVFTLLQEFENCRTAPLIDNSKNVSALWIYCLSNKFYSSSDILGNQL